jgi:PPM family protein phosphatase
MDANPAQLEVGARSETGYVRDENQDRMTGDVGPFVPFYIVADGMGGHKGGALAAQLAVQELTRQIKEGAATETVEQVIQAAFKKANETIYQKGHAGDPEIDGMGTTAVLLLISGRVARLAHVGDSRAYLYRDGVLKQLTTDHTMVQKMVEAGMLRPEDAASILERAIGTREIVEVDISKELPLKDGDAILLCSDGLSGYVTNEEIESALRSPAPSQEITTRLVNLALEKGGRDNVTVQFIQYGPRKEPPPVEPPNPARPTTATAVVSASGHSEKANQGSEARPVEPAKIEKPATVTPSRPDFFLFYTIGALILGAAISASGLYAFMNKRMAGFQGQLEETKHAKVLAEEEVKSLRESANKSVSKWRKELEETKTARVRAENRAKELETDLKKTEIAKTKAEKRVKDLETDVTKTRDTLKKAETAQKNAEKKVKDLETEVSKIRDDFKKIQAAKTKVETDLKEKERELQEAKKQIPTPASKATQSKEPSKPPGGEGTTAPGKTSVPGATPGQTETPEPK